MIQQIFKESKLSSCLMTVLGSAILAFGLYHVHSMSGVTEGGVLGLNLLLEHWFGISPSITNFVASTICYVMGWRLLGRTFLFYSAVSAVSFSVAYRILEQFPPLWPQLYHHPLLAAVLGALFVGIGTGLVLRSGASSGGFDILALILNKKCNAPVAAVMNVCDAAVILTQSLKQPLEQTVYGILVITICAAVVGRMAAPDAGGRRAVLFFKRCTAVRSAR